MPTVEAVDIRSLVREDFAWTSRQRDVLNRIVDGKSNQQIADELGISLDGAKWHMREILSKLNVETREDAAEYWRLYNGVTPRLFRMFRGVFSATAIKWAAGTAGVAAVAVVALAVYAVVNDGSGSQGGAALDETPTATATGTAQSSPAPAPPVTAPVGYAGGTRSGISEVDRVIAAVIAGDRDRIAELMVYEEVQCTAGPPTQIGAPPQCPAGVPGGSTIEAFGHGSCEGTFAIRGDDQLVIDAMSRAGKQLYAVWPESEATTGIAGVEYAVLFAEPVQQYWHGYTYYVSDEGIVYFNGGCGNTPEGRINFLKPSSYILPPPPR